jgi:hypothetical protein
MHGVRVPPWVGFTCSSTLPHAVELAAHTLPQQPANTFTDHLSLRLTRRARKKTKAFDFVFIRIHRRLAHVLCTHALSRLRLSGAKLTGELLGVCGRGLAGVVYADVGCGFAFAGWALGEEWDQSACLLVIRAAASDDLVG